MSDQKHLKTRLESFDTICYIVKALALFFCFYPLFDLFFSYAPSQSLSEINLNSMLTTILLLVLVLCIWLVLQSNAKQKTWRKILEIGIFFLVCCASVLTSGGCKSDYKFLFIFIVVTYTLQYGTVYGVSTAALSTVFLFVLDIVWPRLHDVEASVQSDLALAIMFLIVSVIIGRYASLNQTYIAELTALVNVDNLTGMYNHRYFHDALQKIWEAAKKDGSDVSVVLMDIDQFKEYNELCGHQKGDEAIKQVSATLMERVPAEGVVCRYGGEKFAVILPGTSGTAAAELAESLRVAVLLLKIDGEQYMSNKHLTISSGVSVINAEDKDYNDMINRAEQALYRAKYLRKNSVELYQDIFERFTDIDEKTRASLISVRGLVSIVNMRDNYTYNHTMRVATCCGIVAEAMKLSEQETRTLLLAAYMHDVGKIEIAKNTLIADRRLNEEEWIAVRKHPGIGRDMLIAIPGMENVAMIVGQHHERYDGMGYPEGLKGEQINPLSCILSLADSFDAMTNNRPYQNRRSYDSALAEISDQAGRQFNPKYAPIFIKAVQDELARSESNILKYFPEEK